MTIITVNTGTDDTTANNGLISLREALSLAASSAGADTITFASSVTTVELTPSNGALVVKAGEAVTIDGDRDDDGVADVTVTVKSDFYYTKHLVVEAGATATLEGLVLTGGRGFVGIGARGRFGDAASSGEKGTNGTLDHRNGTDGTNAALSSESTEGGAAGDGTSTAGSIINLGNLTLSHVTFDKNTARGGEGGQGGQGGFGGYGGAGGDAYFQMDANDHTKVLIGDPGNGGNGGNGSHGGDGGYGGDAAGAVLNAEGATLRLSHVTFTGNVGYGGQGGAGGAGGVGGGGGRSGYPDHNWETLFTAHGGNGGNGGNGGSGGSGGQGGSGAGAVLNYGKIIQSGTVTFKDNDGVDGALGTAGKAGAAGSKGYTSTPQWHDHEGQPGMAGVAGTAGSTGTSGDTIFNAEGGTVSVATTTLALSGSKVVENAKAGTVVGSLVVSGSAPTDTFAFKLLDDAGGRFVLSGSKLVVKNGVLLDYEKGMSDTVTVQVTDKVGTTLTKLFSLAVTNVNEAPQVTSGKGGAKAAYTLAENKQAITTLKASDVDGNKLSWSLSGKDAALFALNAKTGALTFKAAPDFEASKDAGKNNVYDVTLKVSDGTASDTQALSVKVTNVKGVTRTGDAKPNTLKGAGEEDRLSGKGGNDTLKGMGGRDTFVFDTALSTAKLKNVDKIADFNHADDTFEFSNGAKVFAGLKEGHLTEAAFKLIANAASTKHVEKDDRILYDKAHGDLYFDADGSGTKHGRVKFAEVTDKIFIDHTDFLVV